MKAVIQFDRSERMLVLLGGKQVVQLSPADLNNPAKVAGAVTKGLPVASAQYMREHSGVCRRTFDQIVPPTALIDSNARRLSKPLSETVLRAARMISLAEEAFGDRERSMSWLNNPNPVFADEAPITLAGTESGTEWVEQVLVRVMYGVDA